MRELRYVTRHQQALEMLGQLSRSRHDLDQDVSEPATINDPGALEGRGGMPTSRRREAKVPASVIRRRRIVAVAMPAVVAAAAVTSLAIDGSESPREPTATQARDAAADSAVRSVAPPSTALRPSPRILSIKPRTARPGRRIVVTGVHLAGEEGAIVGSFGSTTVPAHCTSAQRCVVTVPPPDGSKRVRVRLSTGSGLSNGVTFHYQ